MQSRAALNKTATAQKNESPLKWAQNFQRAEPEVVVDGLWRTFLVAMVAAAVTASSSRRLRCNVGVVVLDVLMASSFSNALVYKGPTTAPMTDIPSSPGSDKYARQDGDDDETYELLLQLKELRCARLQALIDLKEVRGRAAHFFSLFAR